MLSPILAEPMARSGYSKRDVQEYLFKRARILARKFEQYIGKYTHFIPDNRAQVDLANIGKAPRIFAESDDPDRRWSRSSEHPAIFLIAVSGVRYAQTAITRPKDCIALSDFLTKRGSRLREKPLPESFPESAFNS